MHICIYYIYTQNICLYTHTHREGETGETQRDRPLSKQSYTNVRVQTHKENRDKLTSL